VIEPIAAYCKQEMAGWQVLPSTLLCADYNELPYTCAFIRPDGIHVMASVKQRDTLPIIHVSIGPIYSYRPDITKEQLLKHIDDSTCDILENFFGDDVVFARAPDDARKPDIRHYFSPLRAKK
jgi:hypothetical protein